MPVLACLAAVGLAACGGGSNTDAAPPSMTTTTKMPDMAAMSGMAGMAAPANPGATADPAAGTAVATDAVTIDFFAFSPAVVTVRAGTVVTWTNKDEEAHTVFSQPAGLHSPVLDPGSGTYSFRFVTAGTYVYHCTIHPFMHGTVVVTV